jgi:hypothetical protein
LPRPAPRSPSSATWDFTLALGELFTLVVYSHLILEQAELIELEDDVLDTVFDVLVRDFYAGAVDLHGKRSSSRGAAALGVARGAQARHPCRAVRPHLATDRQPERILRDEPLTASKPGALGDTQPTRCFSPRTHRRPYPAPVAQVLRPAAPDRPGAAPAR